MTEFSPAPEPTAPTRRRGGWLIGFVVVVAAAAIPLIAAIGDDGHTNGKGPVVHGDAVAAVRAAVGTTLAAGGYDMTFTSRSSNGFQSTGTGTVNAEPYAMVVFSNASSASGLLLYVNTTSVWQGASANGTSAGGVAGSPIPLSSFAATVEGALGPGPGAAAMLGLSSRGGYLNLEQAAVADASVDGTGTVDGVNVTYYDVTIDLTKLIESPDLSDEERTTMQAALPVLKDAGYTGTQEKLGVDADGYIREVDSTTKFADGSSSSRHSTLSHFGCAATVYTPDQPVPPVTTTLPCAPPPGTAVATAPAPTTTSTPTTSTPTTSAPTTSAPPTTGPSTTTSEPPTSTTVVPTTVPTTS